LGIDSAPSLSSYQDYRFRAPNVLLLQGDFEHSIWGPFGLPRTAPVPEISVSISRECILKGILLL